MRLFANPRTNLMMVALLGVVFCAIVLGALGKVTLDDQQFITLLQENNLLVMGSPSSESDLRECQLAKKRLPESYYL